ncbi:unnamed protein product [Urochloa decumbens]|uniref:HMG box domain-containing protein n=1 Tax=Urochloa decumbens TaxID=240449 RepID=A0ABC9CTS5_9POAL
MKSKAGSDASFKATGAKRKKAGGPKRGLTPFFAFLAEFRPQYLEKHPESKGVKDVTKAAGEKWRSMSDEEKAKYRGGKPQEEKASKPANKKKESTSSKKAKTDGGEGDDAEGSDKSKSEVEDDDEQDGNEDEDEE